MNSPELFFQNNTPVGYRIQSSDVCKDLKTRLFVRKEPVSLNGLPLCVENSSPSMPQPQNRKPCQGTDPAESGCLLSEQPALSFPQLRAAAFMAALSFKLHRGAWCKGMCVGPDVADVLL